MGAFLAYNLKLSFCFVLFYILYKTVLSRNTFYRINRRVLLYAYLIILFVPLIVLPTRQSTDVYLLISGYEQFFIQPTEAQIQWTDVIVSVYLAGILFFCLRYLYFTAKIGLILVGGERVREQTDRRHIVTNKQIAPFSWMNFIVISRADLTENRDAIMTHESAHIANNHFIDLLIADFFSVIQWYNPSIWLIKNELKDVHEYEADDMVLDSGFNPKQYQLLLIKKAVGSQRFNSMTNSLNHSKLKKRITMMLKEKSSQGAKMKYLTILPLIAFALAVFARPEISENLDRISEVKVSELSSIFETTIENFSVPPEKNVVMRPLKVLEKDTLPVKQQEELNQQMEALRRHFESEEWKEKMKGFEMSVEAQEKLRRQMEDLRAHFESREWKQQVEELQKRFQSEEWKQQMKQFEISAEAQQKVKQQMEEIRKNFESGEWKQQIEALQKQFQSEEWKQQMEELQKRFETDNQE